jgi:cytochrome c biogenesis protein CcmG/thiol:disulfide interchange protein DsbE
MRLLTQLSASAVGIAVAAGLLSGCGSSSGRASAANTAAQAAPANATIGALAPAWTLPLSTGGTLTSASLKGKPVYLNFFATWCPPCNDEASSVNALAQKYKSTGLVVVGVDEAESAAKAQLFVTEHHLSYPAVVDGGVLRDAYLVNGLPVHAFIGRDGKLQNLVVGQMEPAEIEAAIKKIVTASSTSRTSR